MKRLKLYLLPLIFLTFLLFSNCNRKPVPAQTPLNWTSDDPLSVPYRIRQQKLEKGNLVWNSSFESGKNLIIDSTGVTYRIDGWQKIGDNVQWVNIEIDSIYDIKEAFDSIRAIRIHREFANETDDPGEGVVSDFIKIIPGNYELSFYIRLNSIKPNRSRLGTRIFDAINIRLLFFDKNKIEITSKEYDPYRQIFIDNSFKGYSFSNFYEIDDFPWAKVTGKSCNVPCADGDVPDEARYVKIFLGLKGNGTMWIDQVDFRYSKQNFSFLERMEKLMDTTLLKQEIIIPQPKKVDKLASIPYFNAKTETATDPIICIPENPSFEAIQAANLLKLRIESLFQKIIREPSKDHKIKIETLITNEDFHHCKLIFSIGKTNLFKRFRDILPLNEISGKAQGYFIYTTTDLNNVVFLYGNEPVGDYYAAASAIQLFDNKKFIFHNAQVIDYPDFLLRNVRIDPCNIKEDLSAGTFEQLLLHKINGAYFASGILKKRNKQNDLNHIMRDFPDYHSILSYSLLLEVGNVQSGLKNNDENQDISSSGLLNGFLDMIDEPNKIIISPAYPQNTEIVNFNLNYRDIEYYAGLIGKFADIAGKKGISDCIAFVPLWRNNEEMNQSDGKAEIYLSEMKNLVGKNVRYLWNGCSWNSYYTNNADLVGIKSILGSNPVWWDNSMLYSGEMSEMDYHPAKLNLFNLFMPFDNQVTRELLDNIDSTQVFINFCPESEFDFIRLITVSDFLWNSGNYDPDVSLWKILQSKYGSACAKELILFADIYAALLRLSIELKDPVHHQRLIRKAMPLQEDLKEHLIVIKRILGNEHQLAKELQLKSDNINSKIPLTEPDKE
jgi:hypothetical protein